MLINLRNALMTGERTPTVKDYVQDGLIAMWDGLEGNFTDLFGHESTETDIVRVTGGIYCTSSAATISLPSFSYGENGSFSAFVVYSGFPIQSRRDLLSSVANRRGFTLFNTNNAAGMRFECYQETSTEIGNSSLVYGEALPSSGTMGCCVDDRAVSATKTLALDDSIVGTQYISKFAFNNALVIRPLRYCTIHNIRLYSRALTADEIAANYAIDKARFGLP